jgi:AcrR family transcriptional regulator
MTAKPIRHVRRQSTHRARQVLADFRRRTILDAARAVFARRGFAATTMDLIADEADVAKGTLYLYYPSKAGIYSAAVISGLEELASETIRVSRAHTSLRDVLRAFFETRRTFFEKDLDFFRIYSQESGNLGQGAAEIRREFARLQEAQVDALQKAIAAAARSGEIRRVNTRTAALAAFDLSHGVVVRRLRGTRSSARELDDALDLLWKGLSPQ